MGGPGQLFFARAGGSESPTLSTAAGDGNRSIDPAALAGWVRAWPPSSAADTPYREVSARVEEPSLGEPASVPACSRDEAPAFVLRALESAVERAVTGFRRVAVLAGGGLDSSILLALAVRSAKRSGASVFAVASDYEGPGDDRPHLRALEEHLGCEVVRVRPEESAPAIVHFRRGVDAAPFPWPTAPSEVDLLVRARDNGAERALSGAGGDELFGGDPRSLADLAWRGEPVRAIASARAMRGFGAPRSPAWSWVARPLLVRTVPRRIRAWRAHRGAPSAPPWAGPRLRAFVRDQTRAAIDRAFAPSTHETRASAALGDPHRVWLAWNRHLQQVASGLDCWDPFLDPALIRAVTSLPRDFLLHGDVWRGLLRASVRGLLPESLAQRMDKARSETALRRFLEAAGGASALRPLASVTRLASLGLAEPRPFAAAFEHFAADPEDAESWTTLWPALAVESFLRENVA